MANTQIKLSSSFILALSMMQKALMKVWQPEEPLILEVDMLGGEVREDVSAPSSNKKRKLRTIVVSGLCLTKIGETDFECRCEISCGDRYFWEPSKIDVRVGGFEGAYRFEEARAFCDYYLVPV